MHDDGGDGDDVLDGGAGNDNLDGGAGTDTAVFSGSLASYTVTVTGNSVTLTSAASGTDRAIGIERFNAGETKAAINKALPDLKVEQAFEISDASAERSAAGCTIKLGQAPIIEYLTSNVTMLRWMIKEGYGDVRTLERRARKMERKRMERDGVK